MSKIPKQLIPAFVAWARSKGIGKPFSQEAMDFLEARFLMEVAAGGVPMAPAAAAGGAPVVLGAHLGVSHKPFELTWDGVKSEIFDVRTKEPDDFDLMVEQREQALVEGGHDDLTREALLLEQGAAAAAAASPPANTNPVTAATAILGGQATIKAGDNAVEVARWNGNDSETTNVTVTIGQSSLASSVVSQVNQPLQARPYAIARWGTRGVAMQANIDALAGTQFTLGASFVSLSLAMQPLLPYNPGGAGPIAVPMLLSGMLSFNTIEKTVPLTYTVYYSGGAAPTTVAVPAFAKQVTVYCDDTTATFDMIMEDIGRTFISTAKALSGDASLAKTIDLPGDTAILVFSNVVGAAVQWRFVFRLSL